VTGAVGISTTNHDAGSLDFFNFVNLLVPTFFQMHLILCANPCKV
jgi:hypothetical protein